MYLLRVSPSYRWTTIPADCFPIRERSVVARLLTGQDGSRTPLVQLTPFQVFFRARISFSPSEERTKRGPTYALKRISLFQVIWELDFPTDPLSPLFLPYCDLWTSCVRVCVCVSIYVFRARNPNFITVHGDRLRKLTITEFYH